MLSGSSLKKIWLLNVVTFGTYYFYWCAHSRQDINKSAGRELIPSTWYLAIPGLNYYWVWQYSRGLEQVSFKRINGNDVFLVYIVGANFVAIAPSFFRLLTFNPAATPSVHAIIVIVGLIILLLILASALGLAFFCAYVQRRVNALPPAQTRQY
jgi:hypothetical protein